MKCDICDQEFANSEAVKAHKEEVHPMGDDREESETGDGMKPEQSEMPEPAEQRNR